MVDTVAVHLRCYLSHSPNQPPPQVAGQLRPVPLGDLLEADDPRQLLGDKKRPLPRRRPTFAAIADRPHRRRPDLVHTPDPTPLVDRADRRPPKPPEVLQHLAPADWVMALDEEPAPVALEPQRPTPVPLLGDRPLDRKEILDAAFAGEHRRHIRINVDLAFHDGQ